MEIMQLFKFSLIWMNISYIPVLYCLGQSYQNCSLNVENKEEFINNLNKFYGENNDILILEYELDFSRLEQNFDWTNRTDPHVFQPRRWFRTKERNTPQLHFYSQVYLFDVFSYLDIISSMFIKTKVVLSAYPVKCFDDISGNNMTFFIRDSLLEDFNMTFRTISSSGTEICTIRTETPDSFDFTYWCWKYDQERQLLSRLVNIDPHIAEAARVFFTAVTILFYFYIPWLIFLFPRKKCRLKKTSIILPSNNYPTIQSSMNETENEYQENKIFISEEEITRMPELSAVLDILKTESDQICKCQFSEQESLKYTDTQTCCVANSPPAAIKKALQYADELRKKINSFSIIKQIFNIFIKVFVFLTFFTLPYTLSSVIKFKQLSFYGHNANDYNIIFNFDSIMLILSGLIQFFLLVIIFANELKENNTREENFDFRIEYHKGWNEAFDYFSIVKQFSKCFIVKTFVYLILFPIIILFNLIINCPLTHVTRKQLSKSKFPVVKIIFKWKIILAVLLFFTVFPSVYIVQFICITILFLVYQTTFIYSLFSAIILLFLYVRKLLQKIRSKHECSLNLIVNEVKNKATSTFLGRQNTGTFHILESESSAKFIRKDGRLHLYVNNGCFYIKENNTIYVSKDIISHLLRAAYIKTFNKLLSIMIFLTTVLLLIGVLGQFDFFTATQQVIITFGTGVLPFVFNLLFSKKVNKRTLDIESHHQFSHNIDSYAESCKIHDIKLENLTEQNNIPAHVDVEIVIQCEETDGIFRHSDDVLHNLY